MDSTNLSANQASYTLTHDLLTGSTLSKEIFCVPKQTIKSQVGGGGEGQLIGIVIDRDMKNWEFSETIKLL